VKNAGIGGSYQIGRVQLHTLVTQVRTENRGQRDTYRTLASGQTFGSWYFDTALSAGPAALPTLKAFAGSERILFGSDFPYVSAGISGTFTEQLDAYDDFTSSERNAINHGNAWTFFPRLASAIDKTSRKTMYSA
jgi:predicted TIM-barrel fold metal-dependent hydrolase